MKLYPPFKKTKIKLENPKIFKEHIREITEGKYGNTNHKAKLKGVILEKGFLVEKKTYYMNSFKPRIRGKYNKRNDKIEEIELNIESNNLPILMISLILIFCIYGAIKNSIEYAILIFIICGSIFYLISWIFYLIDYKKTKKELNKLINKANTYN